jgi:ubiquinone/menaquinone biosynthesis C-methylase UbiE
MSYDIAAQYRDASNLNARIALHARFSTNPQGWMRWVFAQMRLAPGERILEVGAGPATLWRQNLDRVPPGCDITLTDFSPGMIEEARQNLRGSYPDFKAQTANVEALPFEDAGCDVVIANHMLYHVPDLTKGLSEIRRVLRPGGRLYAATNGRDNMRELTELLARFDAAQTYDVARIIAAFSLENGAELLQSYFFPVRLLRYEDSLDVTEPEPLVAYAASMGSLAGRFSAEKLARFAEFVRQEVSDAVAREGAFRIRKSGGLFEAYRPER